MLYRKTCLGYKQKTMKAIKFSNNWNNKLNSNIFTTIRRSPKKRGETVEIYLKDKHLFNAKVLSCKEMSYAELLQNKELILVDTGLSTVDKFNDVLCTMYKDLTPETKMYVILVEKQIVGELL